MLTSVEMHLAAILKTDNFQLFETPCKGSLFNFCQSFLLTLKLEYLYMELE